MQRELLLVSIIMSKLLNIVSKEIRVKEIPGQHKINIGNQESYFITLKGHLKLILITFMILFDKEISLQWKFSNIALTEFHFKQWELQNYFEMLMFSTFALWRDKYYYGKLSVHEMLKTKCNREYLAHFCLAKREKK